jgi:hypothetical protein
MPREESTRRSELEQRSHGGGEGRPVRSRMVEHVSRVNHQVDLAIRRRSEHATVAGNDIIAPPAACAPRPGRQVDADVRIGHVQDAELSSHADRLAERAGSGKVVFDFC